ncbi:MAG: amino acid permease [Proteobacteria bacterium]|nr:amino acid permease [Pseudomonadota bacterium]
MSQAPRQIGFLTCVALVVGNIIGGGIFLLPTSLAPYGFNSVAAWVLSSAGALLLAYPFSVLARAMPAAGGPYAYTHAAFGPLTAFLVVWGYWISIWVANAAIATAATSYVSTLLPEFFRGRGVTTLFTLGLVWFFTLVNWWGITAAGRVQSVTTVLKMLPLIAVILVGYFHTTAANVAAVAAVPLSFGSTTAACALTFYALIGFESACVPDGKVKDPERTIPRATLVGTILTTLLCTLSATAVILLVPPAALAQSNAPFADAARALWGNAGGVFFTVCAAVSCMGCLNGWTLLQGEVPAVMAQNGVFPRAFAQISPRDTPTFALVVTSTLVSLLVLSTSSGSLVSVFTFMTLLSTIACLVMYAACAAAMLRLNAVGRLGRLPARQGKLMVIGALGLLFSAWTIYGAGLETVLWGLALLAAGLPVYYFVQRGSTPAPAAQDPT